MDYITFILPFIKKKIIKLLQGHVTSYLSTELMKYTSFQVHATEEIRDLRSTDAGVLALTPTSLNLWTRQGIPVFSHR